MASNKKAPWSAKAKYWADGYTGECSGSMLGVMRMMFMSMPADRREKVLSELAETHEQLAKKEAERTTEQG